MNAREIAARFKLRRAGRDWRGACPACGYAAAFTLTERDGRALGWCASCQDKTAIGALLRDHGDGWTPPRTIMPKPASLSAEGRERARRQWTEARPVTDTPAETYLAARHVPELATSPALRFHPACPHPNAGRLPAMVALVVDVAGEPVAVHRTYLQPDGRGKAAVEPAKASLGPIMGGAIRLHPAAPEILIAEGIETAAAAARLVGVPTAWAAVSCGNLAQLPLPADVRSIVIAADNDPADEHGRRPGPDAAWAAQARWMAEGRAARVAMPRREGMDFADLLAEGNRHG